MSQHGVMSVADVVSLSTIVGAAQRGDRVRWVNESGDLLDGVARAISHQGGGFLSDRDDVRDGYLHVSGVIEFWLPVAMLVRMVRSGEFVVDQP